MIGSMRPLPALSEGLSFVRRWATPLSLITGGALLLVLLWVLSLWSALPSWSYDFRAYYLAAERIVQTGSPYQPEMLSVPFVQGPQFRYPYAPLLALSVVPLTQLTFAAASMVWAVLGVLVLAATCALMPVPRSVRLAVLVVGVVSEALLSDLYLGHVSLMVTFCAVLIWRWVDRPIGAAALAAVSTVRPQMGIVLAWWALRLKWRPIVSTAAAAVLIVAITLPFLAFARWTDFLTVLRNAAGAVQTSFDLKSALLALGMPAWSASLGLVAGYVVAGLAVLASLRRDREVSLVVILMSTLLLSPNLEDHYLTLLLLPAALLASRGRRWGLLLPLMTWVPRPLMPLVALLGMLAPFVLPDRGPRLRSAFDLIGARLKASRSPSSQSAA